MVNDSPRGRILVVGDRSLTAETLCNLVESRGFEVDAALGSSDRALELAQQAEVDGAVLEIGADIAARLPVCNVLHARRIPFLVVSPHPERLENGHEWQPHALLGKPVDATRLRSALDSMVGQEHFANQILRGLTAGDLAMLRADLQLVIIRPGTILEVRGRRPESIYFIAHGLVSLTAGARDSRLEVALVGPEGITGASALLGDRTSLHDAVVQVSGGAWRIATRRFEEAVRGSPLLRQAVLDYLKSQMAEVANTALAGGHGSIEARVARRLLQSAERLDSNHLVMTHDAIAEALGVRRPSVTLALQTLERKGLLRSRRRSIELLDHAGLAQLVRAFHTVRGQT
jgi:CRP-like cAMP-binding protein